jgi:hypothetical protein
LFVCASCYKLCFLTLVSTFVVGDAPQPPSPAQPSPHSASSEFLPGPIYNLAQSGPLVAGKPINEDTHFSHISLNIH